MNDVYITLTATALPNEPIGNNEIESVLGLINNKKSRSKKIVLRNNGIKTRYYVIDPKTKEITINNAQLTALAIQNLFTDPTEIKQVDLISAGTTLPDQIAPSHAVMVHGELANTGYCETVSPSGICLSGFLALKYAYLAIKCDDRQKAVATGSEVLSVILKSERFAIESNLAVQEIKNHPTLAFDKDFLRWMLSDGAGAFCLEKKPRVGQLNLKIHWIKSYSFANELETCMYLGAKKQADGSLLGWNYLVDPMLSEKYIFNLKQDVKLLNKNIVKYCIGKTLPLLVKETGLTAESIDYFLPHISSMYFYHRVAQQMDEINFHIPQEKWFTNLTSKGNTGAASLFIMVDELVKSKKLTGGEKLLCFVPESGRFSSGFMLLEVV